MGVCCKTLFVSLASFLSIQKFQHTWGHTVQGPILINVGGPTYVDSIGNVWETDAQWNAGGSYNDDSPIAGTRDEPLYQSQKVGRPDAPPLQYEIPLDNNGTYQIHLHFSEIQPEAMAVGARVFDVVVEGSVVIENLDVYSEVGHHTALDKTVTTHVNDGSLSIGFIHEGNTTASPILSAIEILPLKITTFQVFQHSLFVSDSNSTSLRLHQASLSIESNRTSRKLQQASLPLYINVGSDTEYRDPSGRVWKKDTYYNDGGRVEPRSFNDIKNTAADELYQTGRYDLPDDRPLVYSIPLPNGEYEVRLHFSENYNKAQSIGARKFRVSMEGKIIWNSLDIFQEAGAYSALIKQTTVAVSDGFLTISFGKIVENAKLNAIEISEALGSLGAAPASNNLDNAIYRINMGAGRYVDKSGNEWIADKYYNNGGQPEKWSGSRDILGTTDDELYRESRFDHGSAPDLKYEIPIDKNGEYRVVMHFAETYSGITRAGQRMFDVFLESKKVLSRFDIYAEGGAYRAMKEEATVQVNDGKLTLTFGRISENPKICALEVYSKGPSSSPPPTSSSPGPSEGLFPLYINAGGPALTDSTGISWIADRYFNNGGQVENLSGYPTISGAADSSIFQTARFDPKSVPSLQYNIPCPNGEYSIVLYFAELYRQAFKDGGRVFAVKIENVIVFDAIDIYKESGGEYSALMKTTSTTVNDGILSIEFVHGIENPKISAIEIHQGKSTGTVTSPSQGSGAGPSININCGSNLSFQDSKGELWIPDKYFNTGLAEPLAAGDISGTQDDQLFRSGRYDVILGAPLIYRIPVSNNGDYIVSLLFAETYRPAMQVGARVFSVSVNGARTFPRVDIFGETGAGNKALIKTTTVKATNKMVTIEFGHIQENPAIKAIQVTPSSSSNGSSNAPPSNSNPPPPPPPNVPSNLPIRINVGGPTLMDNFANQWAADAFYNNGGETEKLWNPVTTIYGTANDALYMTSRYDPESAPALMYEIPVPSGRQELSVTLHFAELWSKAMYKGARVFGVKMENNVVLPSVDIYSKVGGFTALKETVDVVVDDGNLSIEFLHITENPKLSAIEIHESNTQVISSELAPPPIPSSYRINLGGGTYVDSSGRTWLADQFFNEGGEVESIPNQIPEISGTLDDELYTTARYDPDSGPGLKYNFPVPDGDYSVTLHMAELWVKAFEDGKRVFDVLVEGAVVFKDVDIYKEAGQFTALAKTAFASVNDGFLTVEFAHKVENPKASAIEIKPAVIPQERNSHRAHAVPGGPYIQTDVDGDGFETIKVDGTFSHTHTAGSSVETFKWTVNGAVVGNGVIADITLPVGTHTLTLDVVDTDGDTSSDYTTVNVKPQGFPDISSMSPPGGDVTGGNKVMISGSGFASSAAKTKVYFGSTTLTGPQINVISESLIEVKQAPTGIMGPALVTVETEVGSSNKAYYAYSDKTLPPVNFQSGVTIKGIYGPTTVAFGPDGKLYVGTQGGKIIKATLDDNYKVIENQMIESDVVAESAPEFRSILGITFDPMDTSPNPAVYVSHSSLFHGDIVDYNGKVSKVTGANLDQIVHVVTGLPVSDHDHGINGMTFDDSGDLYIQVGGNTNAGVPGALSSSGKQDEGVLGAATIVAHLSRPGFDGNVKYDNNGDIINTRNDVEVFAAGLRNSFDIVLHSNGYLYGTDNGPNNKYGAKSTDCDSESIDPHEDDELNLLEKGKYYGHANRKRGEKDPRQCKWRSTTEGSDNDYTAPMLMLPASCNGIDEFQTRHFGEQLRGHLLIGRYKGALYHVVLSNDGRSVVGQHQILKSAGGLDVVQGPDGTLFIAQNFNGQVVYHAPKEPSLNKLYVVSVFPRRGPQIGGTDLTLYGEQFGTNPQVTVGGKNCPVQSNNGKKLTCKLPSGFGKANVVVTSAGQKDTFMNAYRYIRGTP